MLAEARLAEDLAPAERARAKRLADTVLRYLGAIDALLAPYLDRPPPTAIRNILRLAAAERMVDRIPAHAVVSSAVDLAAAQRKRRGYRGLVNAVARKLAQTALADWQALCAADPVFPPPLAARLQKAWGADCLAAMASLHRKRPPVDLTLKDGDQAADYAQKLGARCLPGGGLRLDRAGQISALPGFATGDWWVQDAAAAIPVRMLGDVAGLRVLDLCAAPGGKTMQLAAAGAVVTALDIAKDRLARLCENLTRTRLTAQIVLADALRWQADGLFDIVLLDAPCSASGTMRRHPDLMQRPLPSLAPLVALQDALLDRAFDWVRPGGRLLFATCSLFPQEGEVRLRGFLRRQTRAELLPPQTGAGFDPTWIDQGMLRLRPDFWPEIGGMDGFFAAMVWRTP